MARLSSGDRAAFDPLFRALYPRAVRFARSKLPEDQAADAAQRVLMKVFARASQFEPGRPALPWFYAVAGNELRTLERQAAQGRRRQVAADHADAVAAPDDPERLLLDRELHAALDRAVAELDDESADAILAMLGEARRPGLAPATFRKRVSRAYARLRILLGGADGE